MHVYQVNVRITMQEPRNNAEASLLPISNADQAKMQSKCYQFVIPKRYIIVLLLCIANTCIYSMRSNLSIAIVEMTSDRNITIGNCTNIKEAEFSWDSKQKGLLLSLFSYGCLMSSLFGGVVAMKFGGCTVFGFSICIIALLTVLSPVFFHLNIIIFCIARILEGAAAEINNCALMQIHVNWIPKNERTTSMMLCHAARPIGISLNYAIFGYLAQEHGWQAVFYVSGSVPLLWFCIWYFYVSDLPSTDKFISDKEKEYLKQNTAETFFIKDCRSFPWREVIKSKPVWSLMNEYFCWSWLYSFILFCLPLYVKDVHNVNTQDVGLISSIPVVCSIFGQLSSGILADYLRSKKILHIPTMHRAFIFLGQAGTIFSLLVIVFWADFTTSIILFSLIRIFWGISNASCGMLHIDMFAHYASFVRGLTLFSTTVVGIINPIFMGFMVPDHTRSQWNLYFLLLSGFNVWSLVVYLLFGSGELQPWAMVSEIEENQKEEQNTLEK